MKTPSLGNGLVAKSALVAAGLIAGGILATTIGAQAAATAGSSGTSSSTTGTDPHPGDNGADGVPESQEHHGGRHGLDLSGTVTAVASNTVTIKTSTVTTTYTVTSTSDIDKNGEASLSSLAVGDTVTFSVDATTPTQIDKLHAGDEAKNRPQAPSGDGSATTPQSGATSSSTGA
jgi:hypothetical protein